VAQLVPSPATADERSARQECDKRLKVLDAQIAKIRALEEDALKRLNVLEREAIAARDEPALRRVFRFKGGIYASRRDTRAAGFEIRGSEGYVSSGVVVEPGRIYRIRAIGRVRLTPAVECTADGTDAVKPIGETPAGMLLATNPGFPDHFRIGVNCRFEPKRKGELHFLIMDGGLERLDNTGGFTVLIEEE
jgi:hypothetical protein